MNIRIAVTVADRHEASALVTALNALGWKTDELNCRAQEVHVTLDSCEPSKLTEFAKQFEVCANATVSAVAEDTAIF